MAVRITLPLILLGVIYQLHYGASQPQPTQHPPLVTTCQVMSLVTMDINTATNGTDVSCSLSDNCTQISCGNTRTTFLFEIEPCGNRVSLRIATFASDARTLSYESLLYGSQMLGLDLGYGFTTLNFTLVQRSTRFSIGLKVDSVNLATQTSTSFISRREIPVDIYSCPGSIRPRSELCQVIGNIAQYLNYFFTGILGDRSLQSTPDCIPSKSCNDIICHFPDSSYDKISILPCQSPAALRLVNVLSNGTVLFDHESNSSEVFTYPPMEEITLNVTFKPIHSKTVGLALSFTDSRIGNQSITEIPYVEVPLNKSTCARNYTSAPLIRACDVLPHLSSPECLVDQSSCTKATCQITELNAMADIILYNCLALPEIGLVLSDSQGNILNKRPTSKSTVYTNPRDGSQLLLTVIQHTNHLTVGVQVSSLTTNETYIQYSEVPINRSKCPNIDDHPDTITCETMRYIAQYLNVFFANVTKQRESTPDCGTIEPNCNNVTCTFIDNSYYTLDVLPCVSPPVLHLEYHLPNGTAAFKHTFTIGIQTVPLDENTQLKVTLGNAPDLITIEIIVIYDDGSFSFTLPAIPSVLVPLDTSICKAISPSPPAVTTPDTGLPNTTFLAIVIAAPVGGVLLCTICVMCCIIMCLCVRQSRLQNTRDNYSFQRLSIAAQDYEDETDDEEDRHEGEERQQ